MSQQELNVELNVSTPNYQPKTMGFGFTQLKSPVMPGQSFPTIDDNPGAGKPGAEKKAAAKKYADFSSAFFLSLATPSVKGVFENYSVDQEDQKALDAASKDLVQAVIDGDSQKAILAIRAGADPNRTVSVLDPADPNPSTTKYVVLPLGVAALVRGREVAQSKGLKSMESYDELAYMLLHNRDGDPRIEMGSAPDGQSQAVGYRAHGIAIAGDAIAGDAIFQQTAENRWANIPMWLSFDIDRICPKAARARVTPASPDGIVYGEDLPDHVLGSAVGMVDPNSLKIDGLRDNLIRFRAQKASLPDVPAPKTPKL